MGATVTDPLVGRLVDSRYEVVSRIARGGMATVYLAVDRRLDRDVALKVMHPHLAEGTSGSDFVARFRREARTAARLTHPGLVRVYDQGVDGETSYLTMEYIDGANLRRHIGERGALTSATRCASARACWTRSPRRTAWVWCTATSSPRTSCSTPTAGSSSPTSAWHARSPR